jgi:biopolymer transport protein ExbD
MPRRPRSSRQAPNPPVESFSDIAFLLIIFFILTTTLVPTLGVKTEMPASTKDKSEEEKEDKTPSINIKGSQIFFDAGGGEPSPTNLPNLALQLQKLELDKVEEPSKKIVLLETSGGTRYETYYRVIALISQNGGVVGMMSESEDEE